MKSSPVSTRLAALAIATMVIGGLGTAPGFAAPEADSTASNSAKATESPTAAPTPSAIPEAVGTSTPSPTPNLRQPTPTSIPSPSSTPSSLAESGSAAVERPSNGGAVMGQAGKQAPQVAATLAQPFSTFSEPTVGEQPPGTDGKPLGLDVSGWQKNVNWTTVKNSGARFAYVKTSEGPWTLNDYFAQQYNGAANAGLLRGGYHFARPNLSSGASQAQVMLESGGGWSADGKTLPPALDIEDNPYVKTDGTNKCYGMSAPALVSWVNDFTRAIKASTGKDALIYTSYYFWQECFGNSNAFANSNPLWIAAYYASSPWMPGQWPQYTFWQYANNYADAGQTTPATFPGDQNVFSGTMDQLRTLAGGTQQSSVGMVAGATPLSGKWAGDGKTYVGWFKDAQWCLGMPANSRRCFYFGAAGDKPVVGDWDGNGTDSVGIVRNAKWYLSNSPTGPSIDYVTSFGIPTDTPLTGDWDGQGRTGIGIFRNGVWALSSNFQGTAAVSYVLNFGESGDQPLTGDWDGDGKTSIGIFRRGVFALNNSVKSSQVSEALTFGNPTDSGIVGDWDGNRTTTSGIVRGQEYYLTNNNSTRQIDLIVR